MFTIEQIESAHEKVNSGADFPKYIQEIKTLGIIIFETWVKDSHTNYFGEKNFSIQSTSQYTELTISENVDQVRFKNLLKEHQQGKSDYLTFCKDCADTGIEKWVVNLNDLT